MSQVEYIFIPMIILESFPFAIPSSLTRSRRQRSPLAATTFGWTIPLIALCFLGLPPCARALSQPQYVENVSRPGSFPIAQDGAAAAIVMSAERAKALGIKPLARYVSFATAGYKPEEMGLGPVFAIPKALKLAGLKLPDIDVIELNEAFAAQSLAVIKEAGLDPGRVNPNGGAIALGHPLGCTGAKLTATIIRELKRRHARYGLVTMCVGGGMGAAGIFENLN